MKSKIVTSSLCALALSAFTAQAWDVSGVVSCPNGATAAGIRLYIQGTTLATTTSGNGAYFLVLPDVSASYTICVDSTTLPLDSSVVGNDCAKFSVDDNDRFANVDFTLTGAFCETNPPPGPCWLTGGGTIGKTKGIPNFSFGGVVNPGCSPTAAGGGNWNLLDNVQNLHFKGTEIVVTGCSGVPTKSPKVDVNRIDFVGVGTLVGIRGNSFPHGWSRAVSSSSRSRKVRAPLGALPGNAWASPTSVGPMTDSATENTPPTPLSERKRGRRLGKGEKVR